VRTLHPTSRIPVSIEQLAQYIVSGVTLGSVYAIVAIGFTIIFKVTGIINFAQGEFVMLGGMISYSLMLATPLPAPLVFLIAIAATACVGFLLDRLAIRRAKNSSVISLIIITIGASILIRGLAGQAWGKDAVPLAAFSGETPIQLGAATLQPQSLWVIATMLMVMASLKLVLDYTLLGKALSACAINRRAAGLLGIDAQTMSLIAFSLSAGMGALAGIVIAPMTLTSYNVGVMLGLKGFAAAAIGGFGSQLGAILGGLFLGLAESLGAAFISSAYKDAIALLVLFLVLLWRAGSSRENQ
jgi:branched-chain amino acid transport system permease protein